MPAYWVVTDTAIYAERDGYVYKFDLLGEPADDFTPIPVQEAE